MSVHPTITHGPRRLALVGGLLAALAVGSSAAAADASWTGAGGNPNCSAVGSGYRELKIEPVRQGRHPFGDGQLSGVIDVRGVRFDWSANQGVDAVIVKGGPVANIYRTATEVTRGTGLHAPINRANGAPYGLSHITFCYDLDQPPAPPRTPGPCEPGGATTMPDGQPCDQGETSSATAGAVLGARATTPRVAARARMRTPSRCVTRPFRQVVRGTGIRRVTFFVHGRRVARLAGSRTAYAVKIDPRAYATRAMRITARVEYVAASRKRATTLRATVLRCAPSGAAVQPKPRFAG
jgi:hypothetical protein